MAKIPTGVWALGFVSLLMDVSSEMVHSLLPMFMVGVLGASALTVGVLEGLAEATALGVKVFSGPLSDYLGKRKGLAVIGYSLGALTKPLFAIAPTMGFVMSARLLDRVGKGIRGAPRDALIADLTPARNSWRSLWLETITGYRRRLFRTPDSGGSDAALGERF